MENSLSSFHYCPRCGTPDFNPIDEKAMGCPHCGLRYYANVAAAVALFVIDNNGNMLSVIRGREPAKGTWDLPGGFVDPNESAEEAVLRELFEETGLRAEKITYLLSHPNIYPYSGIDVHTCDLFYVCVVKDLSKAKADDDAQEVIISAINDIEPERYGLSSIRYIVEKVANKEITLE